MGAIVVSILDQLKTQGFTLADGGLHTKPHPHDTADIIHLADIAKKPPPKVVCREICHSDLDAVADLLTRGFAGRTRGYWMQGLLRQTARRVPEGYPRHGYLLDCDGTAVGVVIALFSHAERNGEAIVRCNLGGWYVEPAFRGHAPRLLWTAMKDRRVTYLDVTPAISTFSIIERIGFMRYCSGLFVALPRLSPVEPGMIVDRIWAGSHVSLSLTSAEFDLLSSHADYGCTSVVCHAMDGEAMPFIFAPVRIRRGRVKLPLMQLIYCRDLADFTRCSGAIGRLLAKQAKVAVLVDANARIPGLPGFYTEVRGRKYFKGPHLPRLGDLADTELVVFGT